MTFVDEILDHAKAEAPNECCGLVVAHGKKHRLIRAKNLAARPMMHFDLDPSAWLEVADDEEVIGIYHSHPRGTAEPSMADLTACEASGLPWHIVNLEGYYTRTEPSGFLAPYERRPYVHGIHDCYAVCRDWYEREWKLRLPDVPREDGWWDRGQNLYLDHLVGAGFHVLHDTEPQVGDGFLIQFNSPVPNHAAVYVGNGRILHHQQGRLSRTELYNGMWQKATTHHLRHATRMGELMNG